VIEGGVDGGREWDVLEEKEERVWWGGWIRGEGR